MANIALPEKHLAEELERYESADQDARLRRGTYGHKMDGNLGANSRPTLVSQGWSTRLHDSNVDSLGLAGICFAKGSPVGLL
jgi:hypothetical protein